MSIKIKSILSNFMLLSCIVPVLCMAECNHLSEPMTPEAIMERIKPVGKLEVEGGMPVVAAGPVQLAANAGEERYKSSCAVCHATGVAGAPKYRNAADWKPRMTDGVDGLLKVAIQGKNAMPPKGTCMQCSDEELRMAIEYMLPK